VIKFPLKIKSNRIVNFESGRKKVAGLEMTCCGLPKAPKVYMPGIGECFLIIYKQNVEVKYAMTNMECDEETSIRDDKKTWEIEICHRELKEMVILEHET